MKLARRASLTLSYNGADISTDIAPYLLSLTYTDNASGKADDLQIELQDREGRWMNSWAPEKGATLLGELRVQNWRKDGDDEVFPLGSFQIDEITLKGPPSTVTIKAASVPITSTARQEGHTKGWEEINLSAVAKEISERQGLEFFWDSKKDPLLKRRDQTDKSDLGFLLEQCSKVGLALKVTAQRLVVFDEREYEEHDSVASIRYEHVRAKLIKSYSFKSKTSGTYKGARNQYHNPVQDMEFDTYVSAEEPTGAEQILNIHEEADSIAESEEIASDRLYEANKKELTGDMSMMGNLLMCAGSTIDVVGFGFVDGKYFIEKVVHKYAKSSGFTTDISIRKGGAKFKKGTRPPADSAFPTYGGDANAIDSGVARSD